MTTANVGFVRVLVIGGTRLVGRHIAAAALDRGHEVTLFNRGQTDPTALPDATHLVGDRDGDMWALADGEWDATVDVCAYVPRQVRSLLDALGGRAGRYTFISTLSVYSTDLPESGFTEAAPLLEPAWADQRDMERYGELKVGCEQQAVSRTGGELLAIRPGYVVGPHDYSQRFTHWVRVVRDGAPITGPSAEQPLQCIDGRDLGAFTIGAIERGLTGEFNITAPQQPPTFAEVLATIARGLGVPLPPVTWTEASDDLPLSDTPDWWPLMRADVSKAMAAGLTWRPLEDTVRDLAAELDAGVS
jgi:2'-hydroxyisoflavone reductase